MSGSLWVVVGTVIGGLLSYGGQWLSRRDDVMRQRNDRARTAAAEYLAAAETLLNQKVRFVMWSELQRKGHSVSADPIPLLDSLHALVTQHSRFRIVCPAQLRQRAEAVRQTCTEIVLPNDQSALSDPVPRKLQAARAAIEDFGDHCYQVLA